MSNIKICSRLKKKEKHNNSSWSSSSNQNVLFYLTSYHKQPRTTVPQFKHLNSPMTWNCGHVSPFPPSIQNNKGIVFGDNSTAILCQSVGVCLVATEQRDNVIEIHPIPAYLVTGWPSGYFYFIYTIFTTNSHQKTCQNTYGADFIIITSLLGLSFSVFVNRLTVSLDVSYRKYWNIWNQTHEATSSNWKKWREKEFIPNVQPITRRILRCFGFSFVSFLVINVSDRNCFLPVSLMWRIWALLVLKTHWLAEVDQSLYVADKCRTCTSINGFPRKITPTREHIFW